MTCKLLKKLSEIEVELEDVLDLIYEAKGFTVDKEVYEELSKLSAKVRKLIEDVVNIKLDIILQENEQKKSEKGC